MSTATGFAAPTRARCCRHASSDPHLLPPNAQTWVNLHLLFTHGNGAVMSPVCTRAPKGFRCFTCGIFLRLRTEVPRSANRAFIMDKQERHYVVVRGRTPEFDYPKGSENAYTVYDGAGGVPLTRMVRKIIFAHHFNDMNLLLSSYITDDSRIMIRRNIGERLRTIALFLSLDHDPYLVISEGRRIE